MDTLLEEEKWIEDLKRLEEELYESEQLNSAFFNAVPDMVFLIHKDGTYLDYHAKDAKELLVTPEMFLGRNVREIMPPKIADEVFARFKAAEKARAMECFEYKLEINGFENTYECRIIQTGEEKFLSIVRNVAEQSLSLKVIAESEKRFEAQYRNNPVPTFIWTKTGDDFVLIDFNYAAANAENGEAESLLNAKASERYVKYPVIFEGFNQCFNQKKTVEIEMPYFLSNLKEEKYIFLTYIFIPPDMVMLHVQDLTQQKRALKELQSRLQQLEDAHEEINGQKEKITRQYNELKSSRTALETEKERYRELFDSAPDGYLITDKNGIILEANQAAAVMLEIRQFQLKGFPITEFVGQEDRKGLRTLLTELQEKKAIHEIEKVFLRNRQEEFQAAVTVSYLMSEGEENFRWIIRDITEKKRARRELQQSEEFNRRTIDSSNDCIEILDLEGKLIYLNRKGQELMELDDGSRLGAEWLDFWNESDRELLKPEIEKAKKGGIGNFQGQSTTPRGTSKWWDVQINPITDVEGRVERLLVISRDITEQKLAAEKLLQKEKFFRALIEDTHDIITVLRLDGTIIYESPACQRILGYRLEERIGQSNFDYIHPDDLTRFKKIFEEAVKNEAFYGPVEYRSRHKSGFYKTLEINGRLSTDEAGEQVIIANKRDITERRAIEEKLRNSEVLYRNVVETQTEFICRCLPDTTLTFVNNAFCRFIGKSREDLIGTKFFEFVPEEEIPRLNDFLQSLLEKRQSAIVENQIVLEDGSVAWQQWIDHVIEDEQGNVIEIQGIGRDITEQKRATESLRESEDRYRRIVDTMMEGIWVVDAEMRIVFANQKLSEMLGFENEEMIGCWIFEFYDEVTRLRAPEILEKRRKGISEHYDAKLRRKDGSYLWVIVSAAPFFDPGGKFAGSMAMITDISERKQAEEQLQQLSARLLNLQDEERRRLARELHDETAQNLAAISINLASMKKMLSPDNEEALEILRESDWLTQKSLQEVRTLSYLLHPPMLDEGGLVSALRWFINGFSARSGISVEFMQRGEIGRLTSEIETALYRIVQEGLTNINRHSGSQTARIELIKQPDKIIILVKDKGRGLPESESDGTGSNFRLPGVGIQGMRERLRLLGGHLEINSSKKGTTLTAIIPLEVNDYD